MHQPVTQFVLIASIGLCLRCSAALCASQSPQPQYLAPPPSRSAPNSNRTSNPPSEATLEDIRLAVAILQDTTQIGSWSHAAWYVGEAAFPEGFQPLRDFVWSAHAHSDSFHRMPDAMSAAQTSLGFIASTSPQAMRYLIQSTKPSFWDSLPWRDPRRTRREFRMAMSGASIKALGLSGAPEAGQMLMRLRQWPYSDAQRGEIEEAIRDHHRTSLIRNWDASYRRSYSSLSIREILASNSDSLSIVGQWRWVRSMGWGVNYVPPASGWSRTLVLKRDSTYCFWEFDSVGSYRICSGRFSVHALGAEFERGFWIELEGWPWQRTFWLRYAPPYLWLGPGDSRGRWHDHGLTYTFSRETEPVAPSDTISASAWRPPRLIRSLKSPHYWIELPDQLQAILYGMLRDRWTSSRRNVPKEYSYTHYQIPTGVIGDFDGDSLADVALYGYDDANRNAIACVLSNRGSPQGKVVWLEPTRPKRRDELPSRLPLYLQLARKGGSFANQTGTPEVLEADGIDVRTLRGEGSIYYFLQGNVHHGTPVGSNGKK